MEAITEEQIRTAMIEFKNRVTSCEDETSSQRIKYGWKALLQDITKLFKNIIKLDELLVEWRESITIPRYEL